MRRPLAPLASACHSVGPTTVDPVHRQPLERGPRVAHHRHLRRGVGHDPGRVDVDPHELALERQRTFPQIGGCQLGADDEH